MTDEKAKGKQGLCTDAGRRCVGCASSIDCDFDRIVIPARSRKTYIVDDSSFLYWQER